MAIDVSAPLPMWQRYLQIVSYGSIGQSLLITVLEASGVSHWPTTMIGVSYLGALAALGLSNAFGVPLLPAVLRRGPRGLRDRLWNSRLGTWIAKQLHAPMMSVPIAGAIFRPTEVALGLAASELFAALPAAYREQLAGLPMIVQNLEARAATSRAKLNALQGMAVAGGRPTHPMSDTSEQRVRRSLAESVGALEFIRLDLLRRHAGEADLAPITTLLDAAKSIGVDVERLIIAQRDVASESRMIPRSLGFARTPTPA